MDSTGTRWLGYVLTPSFPIPLYLSLSLRLACLINPGDLWRRQRWFLGTCDMERREGNRKGEKTDGLNPLFVWSSLFICTIRGEAPAVSLWKLSEVLAALKVFTETTIFEYRSSSSTWTSAGGWRLLSAHHLWFDWIQNKKDVSISLPHDSPPPEYDAVTKGCGTNSISTVMSPYLGHDITSPSLTNPLVVDTEHWMKGIAIIKRSIEMSKQSGGTLLGWKAGFDKRWRLCLGSWEGEMYVRAQSSAHIGERWGFPYSLSLSLSLSLWRSLSLPPFLALALSPPLFCSSPCCLSDSFDHSALWSSVPKWKRGESRSHRKFTSKLPATTCKVHIVIAAQARQDLVLTRGRGIKAINHWLQGQKVSLLLIPSFNLNLSEFKDAVWDSLMVITLYYSITLHSWATTAESYLWFPLVGMLRCYSWEGWILKEQPFREIHLFSFRVNVRR